jgi:hypothetical protein
VQRARQYWAFRSNPNVYRLDEALKRFETDWWTTKRSQVRTGDRALFWNVKNPGIGVIGFGEVLSDPEIRGPEEGRPFWVVPSEEEPRH